MTPGTHEKSSIAIDVELAHSGHLLAYRTVPPNLTGTSLDT
jgi:hypothetical protein